MPRHFALLCLSIVLFSFLSLSPSSAAAEGRERSSFDAGWRFALGHASDPAKDFNHATGYFSYLAKTGYGDGPAGSAFDDRAWRQIDLPHDWAVELPFNNRASPSHGYKTVGPRFPENSVGWYRRTFDVPASDLGRRIVVEFDGVFRDSRVFVNGFFVGEQPSGYSSFHYDISDYLNYGGVNTIAVRVDASMEEGWYYEGAGIYRHVWLTKTNPVHIEQNGTWVRSEIEASAARAMIDTDIVNQGRAEASVTTTYAVRDPSGATVATGKLDSQPMRAGEKRSLNTSIAIARPALWSLEKPQLYTLVTTLAIDGKAVDQTETHFGLRTIRFDPDHGFFLNGQHVVLKGTNNHQDHAGVGVALPDSLQEFRLRQLKAFGSNAYRTSHHPATPELLDACDRLGMLVIDETRLMGSNDFQLQPLEQMIRRDRNHPSIILWSVGNEEWAIEGNVKGARIAQTMQDFARRIDPTRLTTAAISGGWGGISATIDVAGVNYIKQGDTDREHALKPKQIIVGTEETTTQGTRGIYFDDRAKAHLAPVEDGSSGGNAELGWKHYASRPYTAGVFFWTGFDYRGEATPFGYPAISSQFGILDTCGFPKDSMYYLKSWWTTQPTLKIAIHWNCPERVGQTIPVRVYSNCEEVELELNGTSLGRRKMEPNSHLEWSVKYAPGALVAHGFRNGKQILVDRVETTGASAKLALTPDRDHTKADRNDAVVVAVSVLDSADRVVPTANNLVSFSLKGPGRIIGVGNGDPSCLEPDTYVEQIETIPIGKWEAPDAAPSTEPIVFEATFDRPMVAGQYELLLNALGPKQTVLLNGKALYRDAAPENSRVSIALDSATLREKGNVIRIESNRFENWNERENLRLFLPASLRHVIPAAQWKRSAFNGLAQVIVQPTGSDDDLVLAATAEGLAPASTTIRISR
ncbi:MAG TPA: beta-galactosidase GalA [Opitutaceae bacterium]|nr:beta-galactosidase GalA [Opitutaceae bacterium]